MLPSFLLLYTVYAYFTIRSVVQVQRDPLEPQAQPAPSARQGLRGLAARWGRPAGWGRRGPLGPRGHPVSRVLPERAVSQVGMEAF